MSAFGLFNCRLFFALPLDSIRRRNWGPSRQVTLGRGTAFELFRSESDNGGSHVRYRCDTLVLAKYSRSSGRYEAGKGRMDEAIVFADMAAYAKAQASAAEEIQPIFAETAKLGNVLQERELLVSIDV